VSGSKMKAVFQVDKARLELREIDKPRIVEPGDVLIKISAVGVCGSDRHYFIDGQIGSQIVKFPHILGHECAGVIDEIGPAVTRVKPGDRVAVEPALSCQKCYYCVRGRQNLCLNLRFLGLPDELEGCMKEFMVMPERNVHPLGPALSFEDAVMLEPLAISLYGVKICNVQGGCSIAVFGCGPMGLLTMAAAKACGASLAFATEKVPERIEMARIMGADGVWNPDETDVVAEILNSTDGLGVDMAFECAGEHETLLQSMEATTRGGTVGMVGAYSPEIMAPVNTEIMRRNALNLQHVRRQVHQAEYALRMIEAGQVDVRSMVTHRFPCEQANEAYDLVSNYRDGVVKAIINF